MLIFSCPPAKMPWKPAWRASKLCIWKTLLARHCRTPTFLKFIRARLPVFGKASIKSSNICHIPTLIFELITFKKGKKQEPTCGIIKCKINEEYWDSTETLEIAVFSYTSLARSHTKEENREVESLCSLLVFKKLRSWKDIWELHRDCVFCNLRIDIH